MNGISEFTLEEEEKWKQDEYLKEKSLGLFSLSPKWFKFSNYEILDTKTGFYIAPTNNSVKELYEPFKLFPSILEDYLKLLQEIENLNVEFQNLNSKEYSTEKLVQVFKTLGLRRSEMILPFVQKYGLFGLFNDCLITLEPDVDFINDEHNRFQDAEHEKYIALLNPRSRCYLTSFYQKHNIGNNYSIEYEKLAAFFLPSLSSDFPKVNISRNQANEFYKNYAEPIDGIILYPDITKIMWFEKLMKEYKISDSKPSDIVQSLKHQNSHTKITYEKALNFIINDLGLMLSRNSEIWSFSWRFSSLFRALSIMYVMNKAGKMGPKIQLCQYSKCNEINLGTKYCCPKHANAARQERHRERKGKK